MGFLAILAQEREKLLYAGERKNPRRKELDRKGTVVIMTCGCGKEKEEKGKSIEFESFESETMETISVDEAKQQEEVAEKLRD